MISIGDLHTDDRVVPPRFYSKHGSPCLAFTPVIPQYRGTKENNNYHLIIRILLELSGPASLVANDSSSEANVTHD